MPSPSDRPKSRRPAPLQGAPPDLLKALQKAKSRYLARPDCTGVDLGYRYRDGLRTEELAIRVHLREKLPRKHLRAASLVLPEIDGIPTDVIQAVYQPLSTIAADPRRTGRAPRVQPGLSIGPSGLHDAGTLGAVVWCRRTGRPGLLSNAHVLAADPGARPRDAILQPGVHDGGAFPQDVVAELERWVFSPVGDAALALYTGVRPLFAEPLGEPADGGAVVLAGARMPVQGEILFKSGRSTGVTAARVESVGGSFPFEFNGRIARLNGFTLGPLTPGNPDDEEISADGDSGAVWYDPVQRAAVGLLVAGESSPAPGAERALACYVPWILDALDVDFQPPALPVDPDLFQSLKDPASGSRASTAPASGPRSSTALASGPCALETSLGVAEWVGANWERLHELLRLAAAEPSDRLTSPASDLYQSLDRSVRIEIERRAETGPREIRITLRL